jgi:hypothetical protein
MKVAIWLLLVVVIAAAVYLGVTLRSIHTFQMEYNELPRNDGELQTWLNGQPGVRDVRVQRTEKSIQVQFTTPWWHSATSVDVMGHTDATGYKGRQAASSDHRPNWWK